MRCNPYFTLPLRYFEQQRCQQAAQTPHPRPDIFIPGQAHTLLSLPNEVINLIYHNVIVPDENMDLGIGGEGPLCPLPRHHNNGTKSCNGFSPHCTGIFNLLFLNRQIRRDTVGLYRQKTISLHDSFWFRELLRGASKVGLADVLCKWQLYRALPVKKGKSIMYWQQLSPKERAKKVQKRLRIEAEKWRLREVTVQSGWKVAFDKAKVDVEYSDEEDNTILRMNHAPFLPKWMEVKCVVNFEMRRVRNVREQVRLGVIDQCELMELV